MDTVPVIDTDHRLSSRRKKCGKLCRFNNHMNNVSSTSDILWKKILLCQKHNESTLILKRLQSLSESHLFSGSSKIIFKLIKSFSNQSFCVKLLISLVRNC